VNKDDIRLAIVRAYSLSLTLAVQFDSVALARYVDQIPGNRRTEMSFVSDSNHSSQMFFLEAVKRL
jgi:hypothetical protein